MARAKKVDTTTTTVTTEAPKSVIKPLLKIAGSTNVIEKLFEGDPSLLPVVTSVGIMKVPGSNTFVSFIMKTKGTEVTEVEVGEPNMKFIVEDEAKINFVNSFTNPDDY